MFLSLIYCTYSTSTHKRLIWIFRCPRAFDTTILQQHRDPSQILWSADHLNPTRMRRLPGLPQQHPNRRRTRVSRDWLKSDLRLHKQPPPRRHWELSFLCLRRRWRVESGVWGGLSGRRDGAQFRRRAMRGERLWFVAWASLHNVQVSQISHALQIYFPI